MLWPSAVSGRGKDAGTGRTLQGSPYGWGTVSKADSGSGPTQRGDTEQVTQGFGARDGLWVSLSAERNGGPACCVACAPVAGRGVDAGVWSRDSRRA